MTWGFSDRAATVAAGPAWLMWHFWWSSLNRGTGGGRGGWKAGVVAALGLVCPPQNQGVFIGRPGTSRINSTKMVGRPHKKSSPAQSGQAWRPRALRRWISVEI